MKIGDRVRLVHRNNPGTVVGEVFDSPNFPGSPRQSVLWDREGVESAWDPACLRLADSSIADDPLIVPLGQGKFFFKLFPGNVCSAQVLEINGVKLPPETSV